VVSIQCCNIHSMLCNTVVSIQCCNIHSMLCNTVISIQCCAILWYPFNAVQYCGIAVQYYGMHAILYNTQYCGIHAILWYPFNFKSVSIVQWCFVVIYFVCAKNRVTISLQARVSTIEYDHNHLSFTLQAHVND
jgi:hypothetical protein